MQLFITLSLLQLQVLTRVVNLFSLMLQTIDVSGLFDDVLLQEVSLSGQVLVLLFALLIQITLLVHFPTESLDKVNIAFNTTFIVLVHASSVFIESPKVLL